MRRGQHVRERGFTLIEMLVAITIFGMLMIAVYQSFDQGFRTYETVEDNRERYETARLLLDRIQDDLASAVIFPTHTDLTFVGRDDSARNGDSSDRLVLATLTNSLLDPRKPQSDLVEVEYRIAVDRDTVGMKSDVDRVKPLKPLVFD